MSAAVLFGCHTDVGKRRSNNEDAFRAGLLAAATPLESTLLVLSDGVGGANAGEVASRMAADGMHELLGVQLTAPHPGTDRCQLLDGAMREMDRRVRKASEEPGRSGMGATLSALWLAGDQAWWGQAGDSRIYRFRRGQLEQISRDHSPVGRLRASGKLTEEQARAHPMRNLIDQCLGGGGAPAEPETGQFTVQDGDVFLLCSDGLSDGLWDRDIAAGLKLVAAGQDPGAAAHQLVEQAKEASGKDNITAIVARVSGLVPVASPVQGGNTTSGGLGGVWRRFFGSADAKPSAGADDKVITPGGK